MYKRNSSSSHYLLRGFYRDMYLLTPFLERSASRDRLISTITPLQTRHGLAYKREKSPWTCLFLIREITGRMELEIINPRADSGLTSILTRVKARPWHRANTCTCAVLLFIYASEDINRGRVLSERFGRRLPFIQSRISSGFRCAFPTSNPELWRVKPSPCHIVNRSGSVTLFFFRVRVSLRFDEWGCWDFKMVLVYSDNIPDVGKPSK